MDPPQKRKWSLNNLTLKEKNGDKRRWVNLSKLMIFTTKDFDAWMGSHLRMLFSGSNDPQMWREMRRVSLKCTHDSIMATLRAIQILWLWLILCNKHIMFLLHPSNSAWTIASVVQFPSIRTIALCRTIASVLHSNWNDCNIPQRVNHCWSNLFELAKF